MTLNIMSIKNIRNKIAENNATLRKKYYVKEIGIFGSHIKGVAKAKSDLDILVTFEKGHKDFFNFIRLKYFLEQLLEKKVDLVMKEAIKPRLKHRILREVEYV